MRVFINALAASAGGGLTYIRNVIPELAARAGVQMTVALAPDLTGEFQNFGNIDFVKLSFPPARRFWHEQFALAEVIQRCRADCLLSAGNFALRNSPVPQILLSRNSLYTSADFYRDLIARHEYRLWLETHVQGLLARKSIAWADMTVAPSEAFVADLRRWTGSQRIQAIHHGFDPEAFIRDVNPLDARVAGILETTEDAVKLLFVSHYNYYRNFETLIRALPLIRSRIQSRQAKLLLTCTLAPGANPGAYRPQAASRLVRDLGVTDMVAELGTVSYRQLYHLYRSAHVYVTPAYTETFAHPLVEAMSSGLPVVASDLPVHREICGEAAVYFPRFSAPELADRVTELIMSPERAAQLGRRGLARSAEFSWKKHVDELLSLATSLIGNQTVQASSARG